MRVRLVPLIAAMVLATSACMQVRPGGVYLSNEWSQAPTDTRGYSSYQLDLTVTRDPGSNEDTRFYYAMDWLMDVPDGLPDVENDAVGYMGLQTYDIRESDNTFGRLAIFSLFVPSSYVQITPGRSPDGKVAACHGANTEGDFVTCRLNYNWSQGHRYRYKIAVSGSTWTATIADMSVVGNPTSTIGSFRVPTDWSWLTPGGGAWIEQYSDPPETRDKNQCPARWTTARYENARANGTIPLSQATPSTSDIAKYSDASGNPLWLICQNVQATASGSGASTVVTLSTNDPRPAPIADLAVTRDNGNASVSWAPARNPGLIPKNEFYAAVRNKDEAKLAAYRTIARPLPDQYRIRLIGSGIPDRFVPSSATTVNLTGLDPTTTYSFEVRAFNDGQASTATTKSA